MQFPDDVVTKTQTGPNRKARLQDPAGVGRWCFGENVALIGLSRSNHHMTSERKGNST